MAVKREEIERRIEEVRREIIDNFATYDAKKMRELSLNLALLQGELKRVERKERERECK